MIENIIIAPEYQRCFEQYQFMGNNICEIVNCYIANKWKNLILPIYLFNSHYWRNKASNCYLSILVLLLQNLHLKQNLFDYHGH